MKGNHKPDSFVVRRREARAALEPNTSFIVDLKAEAARLENALENIQLYTRFGLNPRARKKMEAAKAHLERIERTIKEIE